MRVAKWGNSLAIRIPAVVAEVLDLKVGDEVEVHAVGQHSMTLERKPLPRDLLDRLDKYRDLIPSDFRFDRLEANERR